MPLFTIETAYSLPAYRHCIYEADTIDQACRLAVEDDDWSDQKLDYETAGETYVSGIWRGKGAPYEAPALAIPSQFGETLRRKADHFETLLGILKVLAHVPDLSAPKLPFWVPRAQSAIAKAEAILAGAPDPQGANPL
ncbi:hypothetical protein X743_18900 [Mesorhizobium sp. LNHC252B00]|uniref:hypothetical protein n=1 Tax=Mesorhizobium sp. LNHC252B00 TaxID=1287252 RepID=UPI0003CF2750|nr:hypothetical protein [Mesorhizobium sp. LNHC252B00]ESY71799.1 hypothetical protein X743_18900 [Mesorhizobium sp. LNHC252B00]